MKYKKCFLHVDMDAFFASVEQLDHPEWRGKPVIVGGLPDELRSVVSTASYEARMFGVHSAMPVMQAKKLCPQGIFTHGNYKRYFELSTQIMQILSNYSPDLHQISIDEASLEMTGTELLFGEPDTVALKIQEEILENTGLTVSVGLASNAYLAKLASEVNKPKGFYAIPEGKEEDFMLSLPLKKVWGIGSKTLERLNRSGFFTTKDIHLRSKEFLSSVFGECTGEFLYNAVRGLETEQKSPSKHSLSNETTFPVDVTNMYTAETALLDLCCSVMFRILSQKAKSKTIFIKIRYDDFTTITARQTFCEYITSSDDFFEKVKALFEKKYEQNRGIRLLGAGLENIQGAEIPEQETLFDFGEKKKQALEKAILKISQKHPEVKVKKARLLNNSVKNLLLLSFSLLLFSANLKAEEFIFNNDSEAGTINSKQLIPPVMEEAPSTLFNYTTENSEVEFTAEGWWQGILESSLNGTYSKNNNFAFSTPETIFKQQVDLTLGFLLNRQWFFNVNFADEFNKNTIEAGFLGKPENPLKKALISNRNIKFPEGYSMDLFSRGIGGGENQAPGIIFHFEAPETKRWISDFALRYSTREQHDATFYGKNTVSKTTIPPENYMKSQFFCLPPELLQDIDAVYIQKKDGSLKKLSSEEYLVVTARHLLVISKDAMNLESNQDKKTIYATFNSLTPQKLLGDYEDDSEGESISFLKEIQKAFGSSISLKNYTPALFTKISGKNAVILQNKNGFNPFIFANYYDLGLKSQADINFESTSTETPSKTYAAELSEDFDNFTNSAFINEKHIIAELYCLENQSQQFSAENRYPLSKTMPQVYLTGTHDSDWSVTVKKYTPVSNYYIGTNAESGSVRVYKNGILLSGTSYDETSGTVNINSAVSELDKIYITWNESTEGNSSDALDTEAAVKYFFNPSLSQDLAIASSWTVLPSENFSTSENSNSGYATVSTGLFYKNDYLNISNSIAASYDRKNVTGIYRIEGFENQQNETTYSGSSSGFDLGKNQNIILSSELLEKQYDRTVKDTCTKGEKDSEITGYKIPLEWTSFTSQNDWGAVNIKLSEEKKLKAAEKIQISLKLAQPLENTDLYLQLGIDAESDYDVEDINSVPVWKLEVDRNCINWQTIELELNDYNRAFLTGSHDARLIVKSTTDTQTDNGNVVYFGPYKIITKSLFVSADEKANVTSEEEKNDEFSARTISRRNKNSVQKLSWKIESALSTEQKVITAAKSIEETSLSDYRFFKFFFKNADFSDFTLILDRDAESITKDGKEALRINFSDQSLSLFNHSDDQWHVFAINLEDKTVFIDGNMIDREQIEVFVNRKILPSRFKIIFTPRNDQDYFYLDELFLEEADSTITLQDILKLSYKKDGEVLRAGSFSIIENPEFHSTVNAGSTFSEASSELQEKNVNTVTGGSISILNINLAAETDITFENKAKLNYANHSLSTDKPLFNIFSAKDAFYKDDLSDNCRKESSISADFNKFHIPITIKTSAESKTSNYSKQSSNNADLNFVLKNEIYSLTLNARLDTEQKKSAAKDNYKSQSCYNYAESYLSSLKQEFNGGWADASYRKVKNSYSTGINLPFLNISPDFSVLLQEKYSSSTSTMRTHKLQTSFTLPFRINTQSFSANYTKSAGSIASSAYGGSYETDFQKLYGGIENRKEVLFTVPFQDLWKKNFTDNIQLTSDEETSDYSGKYSFSWSRKNSANLSDFFIPNSASCSVERVIQISDSTSDYYVLTSRILNTPLNIFGSSGCRPVFKAIQNDEYAFSLSGSAKIPQKDGKNTLWTLNSYAQGTFFISERNYLKTAVEFAIETDSSWHTEFSSTYNRKAKNSPLTTITSISRKGKSDTAEADRSDSLNITLNYKAEEEFLFRTYEYNHKAEAEVMEHLFLNAGIGLDINVSKTVTSFILSGSIGGKVTF